MDLTYQLHSIDIEKVQMNENRQQIVTQFMHELSTVGFIRLHNIPNWDEIELFNAVQTFHNQIPQEDKDQLKLRHFNQNNKNIFRGFFPFIDNDPSHKEFYDMSKPNQKVTQEQLKRFPQYEESPWFSDNRYKQVQETFQKYWFLMHQVCLLVCGLISEGLQKDKQYFDPWFKDICSSTFRAIHYLNRSHQQAAKSNQLSQDDYKLVTPEHADSGFITILSTFDYPGLQVEVDGQYKSIDPIKNTLILNIGQTLSKISNGRIKATRHRVLDIGKERFSVPFFMEPKYEAQIQNDILESKRKLCEDKEFKDESNEQVECFGEFQLRVLKNSYGEWKGFQIPS